MKTFGEKIKEARKEKKMTQKELAAKIGAAHNSVSDWENNKNKPDPDTIELICGVLDISPNYLMDARADSISPWEKMLLNKYRSLDQRGRDVIDFLVNEEYYRCNQLEESAKYGNMVPMPYAGQRAAAGRWIFDETIPAEAIMVPPMEGADFVIGISGDSMAPTFADGQKVYVKRTADLSYGEIGLFQLGGELYIKELTANGLRSHNPSWPLIPKSDEIIVIGRVLGAVEE